MNEDIYWLTYFLENLEGVKIHGKKGKTHTTNNAMKQPTFTPRFESFPITFAFSGSCSAFNDPFAFLQIALYAIQLTPTSIPTLLA